MPIEQQTQSQSCRDAVVTLTCLYTKQKVQKRKIWHDGKLVVNLRTCCVRLEDATAEASTPTIPLSSVLDQIELSKQQIEQILSKTSQPIIEFENYLVSSWENSTSDALTQNNSATTCMQKLLSKKFRPPTCSSYKPPQKESQFPLKRKIAPLQPGELEQRYYNSVADNEYHDSFQQQYRFDNNPMNKENRRRPTGPSTENGPAYVLYPPDGLKLHKVDSSSTAFRSTTSFYANPQQVNFSTDAPQYDPMQFYGEEGESDQDECINEYGEQQLFSLESNLCDISNPVKQRTCASSDSLSRKLPLDRNLDLTSSFLTSNTKTNTSSYTTLSRSDLLQLFDTTNSNSLAKENLSHDNLTKTNNRNTAPNSPPMVDNGTNCFSDPQPMLNDNTSKEMTSLNPTNDESRGYSKTILSSLIEADSALDEATQDDADSATRDNGAIASKFHFSLPTNDSSSSSSDDDEEDDDDK